MNARPVRGAFGAVRRLALAALFAAAGCSPPASSPTTPVAPPQPAAMGPVTIRILYTSDEHGWIAPAVEKGKRRGGVAELLTRWRQREEHCVAEVEGDCDASATIALSGGDNWTGPALSSYFRGQPSAEALRRMGYAASALGNHELDFGQETFRSNAVIQGIPYVGANVKPWREQGGVTRPFVMVRRQGVEIGVVGLSTQDTPKAGMRDNYKGLDFGPEEAALAAAVPAAYEAGADVVVVIGHVCASELKPIVSRHPEWRLGFVGGGHCHRTSLDQVGDTPLVEPGSFLQSYARVTLKIDPKRPARERVVASKAELVELSYPEKDEPPVTPDRELTALIDGWQKKTDAALGEVIGHTNETLDPDTPALTNFLTDRWREATGADVAILNRFGTRQSVARGPISLGTLYSVLPFNNQLVTVKLTGEQLEKNLSCCGGHVSGARSDDKGKWRLADGKPIDPAKTYTVTATDYAYYGGSGFLFEKQDPKPTFGEDWRLPLIRWLRKNPTSADKGLEKLIDHEARDPRGKKADDGHHH